MADKKISALTAASTPLAGTEVLPIVQSGATVKVAVSDLTAGRAMAASSLTTATVQATNSGGLALKNSGGTTQLSLGAGGGDNITLSVATNITPANAAVTISPTGTGTVTINPATASTINNMSIGATTALAGRFTDVTLTTGNLVVANGQGVDFSATPGTGTSELFADYEEGTWTPVVGGNATYTAQYGTYTKIGRLVTLQFFIHINVLGTGSATQLSGFPYNAGSVGFGQSGSISLWGNIATNVVWLGCYINSSAAVMNFTGNGIIASGTTTYNGVTIFGNNAYVQGTISYTV